MAQDLYELSLRIKAEGLEAAKKALDTVDTRGRAVAGRFAGIGKAVAGIGAAAAGVALGKFLQGAVQQAIEAEQVMSELRQTVNNVGGNFDILAPSIENAAVKMSKLSRFSADASRGALTQMIRISGDTRKSLDNLGLAADLAAAKHIDLEKAGQIVGKVMAGNTKILREMGINTKDSAEAMELLRGKVRGMAEADGKTLQGRLEQLKNSWNEVLESAGKALTGTGSLPDAIARISATLLQLSSYIDRNAATWQRWASNVINAVSAVGNVARRVAEAMPFGIGGIIRTQGMINDRLGQFNDVTGGGSTGTASGGHSTPPARSGGTTKAKAGKEKSLIPDFDFGKNIGSDIMARIDAIGSGEIDILAPIRKRFEETPEELDKILADLNKVLADGPMKRFQEEMGMTISQGFAQTLGDAIYNAFAAAFNGEGIGGILAAFGKTVLAGVGQMFTQLGMVYLQYGVLMQSLSALLPNPFTAGPAGIAIGAALIAMGAALGAVASGGGGRGTARAGAFRERSNSQEIVRLKFVDRPSYADRLAPIAPTHFTIIGENDPRAQRMIGNIVEKNSRRRG